MKIPLIIFIGGGLGSVARYLANRWIVSQGVTVFPYGTFLVNIIGCLLIGFLVFVTEKANIAAVEWRLFLVTGFCGGFTTFSSFAFENIQLLTNHQLFSFILYTLGSIALGFLATYLGILLARAF